MVTIIIVMVIAQMYQVTEVLQQVHQALPQVQVEEELHVEINMTSFIIIIALIGILGVGYWVFFGDEF